MNCNEARKWLSPYLDSELGSTKTFEVSEHLRQCPRCAERFESERFVDETMRTRLEKDAMPAEIWSRIAREVAAPAWFRRWRSGAGWALAACVALVFIGALTLTRGPGAPAEPWIVHHFAEAAPGDRPYVPAAAEVDTARRVLREEYGLRLATTPEEGAVGHHRMELVSVTSRRDARGREFAEVRLNCCGRPVLMVLARPSAGDWAEPLEALPAASESYALGNRTLRTASKSLPGVRVIVASHHPVDEIMLNLRAIDA